MNRPHQRIGSVSNAHVGADFEKAALIFFEKRGDDLSRNFSLDIGLSVKKKKHCFDLGSASPKIIIECKSHRWTAGSKVPSAKMTTWNEAMLYFHLAPKDFRKVFFTLHDKRQRPGKRLFLTIRELTLTLFLKMWNFLSTTNQLATSFGNNDRLSGNHLWLQCPINPRSQIATTSRNPVRRKTHR